MTTTNPWGESDQWADGIPPEIHPGDARVLTALVNFVARPGLRAVEVGSWVGNGSTRVLADALRPLAGRLYCVDTWAGSDNVPHHREYRERHRSLFPAFARNVRRYGGQTTVRPLVRPSREAARLFPDGSLDLVFIDGDHAYSAVRADIAAWLPKVRPGGVLCGHDCDADYAELVPALRRAIRPHREADAYTNAAHPGPPAFHPGVVTAVHERFGRRATLWFRQLPSTVWSVVARPTVGARLRTWLGRPAVVPAELTAADRAVEPWPAEPARVAV